MRILVCVKLASQAQFTDFLNTKNRDRLSSGQLSLNPVDLYTLELALRIKDRDSGVWISVMTMGPDYAEYELRNTLAMGADEAILITDKAFAGADTLRTSAVLAAAVHQFPPFDLILCGKKSIDSETGHIGPQLAIRTGIHSVSNVTDFSLNSKGICLKRCQDSGIVKLQACLPLLLTVCYGAEPVRNPSIAGLRRSRNAPILRLHGDSFTGEQLPASGTETTEVQQLNFSERVHGETESLEKGLEAVEQMLKKLQTGAQI